MTYRVSGRETTTGPSDFRYGDLVERLRSLEASEGGGFMDRGRTSTSAWRVRYQGGAQELFDRLKSAVTAKFDLLEVVEVDPSNEARTPEADLADG